MEHGSPEPADPRTELAHLRALLDEVRLQRDQLLEDVAAQRQQLAEAARERSELRRLLADAQVPLNRLLPAIKELRRALDGTHQQLDRLIAPLESFGQEFELIEQAAEAPPADPRPDELPEPKRRWWRPFGSS